MPGRKTPREAKRLRTLRRRYTDEEREAWAKKAGQASTTKFTSERASAISKARWAKKRAEDAEKQKLEELKNKEA